MEQFKAGLSVVFDVKCPTHLTCIWNRRLASDTEPDQDHQGLEKNQENKMPKHYDIPVSLNNM